MILVTGGTGLVGSHLLYHLSLKYDSIKAIYRNTSNLNAVKNVFSYYSKDFEPLFNKIEWVEADITDVYSLELAFNNVKKVYHAAAMISFNPKDYRTMRKINIEGTSNIVNLCIANKIDKLCFVSSIATLEKNLNFKPIDETCEWNIEKNNYGYAITKYGAEMEIWRASQEGIDMVIVNPGVILGAGFWHQGSGQMFTKIYKGLPFYSTGVTGYVSVKDVVEIMIQLMESTIKNERFIVVSENRSFKDVFLEISKNFQKKPPTIKVSKFMSEIGWRVGRFISFFSGKAPILTKNSAKSIHNKHYYSSEKIIQQLNYSFTPIEQTIKTICMLYKK
ncbi:NAD-dependent epimerase/dehydratase family protein [uncultured Lutibacter sp.]|uniref:NAD-dependent epimerase/dehydratase family protein n=1 Tax=uncultured Lutibacter sp. TaxID=437739 RepID=UPI002639B065|nr:NAD-dependent epimerase/dehydratase family protein [uncultured Lutibacter sp.]